MIRKIIHIDRDACNGCGRCVAACHEGAIALQDGKAVLTRDDYCDGLGDCLPTCPTGAITFTYREAAAYDEAAVLAHRASKAKPIPAEGCPGMRAAVLHSEEAKDTPTGGIPSQLRQWPVQIRLVPVHAPYFDGAHLLIAADCSAFAYGAFHRDFINGRVTLIGCPKLDAVDYREKLAEILRQNSIASVTVVRMEVPCCGGLEQAAVRALRESGSDVPLQVVTLTADGKILEENI